MANLTESIVERVAEVNPVPGRSLVVYERVGAAGLKFVTVIEPEKEFETEKPRLVERMIERFKSNRPLYVAYAVDMDRHLDMKFHRRLQHQQIQEKSFVLKFALEYYVSDPRLLVTSFESDPLKRLQDRIEVAVGGAVAREEWELIRDKFGFVEEEAISAGLPKVLKLASDLGLTVYPDTFGVTCVLPEVERMIPSLVEKTEREKEKQRLEHEALAHQKKLENERVKADQVHKEDLDDLSVKRRVERIGDEEKLTDADIRRQAKQAAVTALGLGFERAAGNVDSGTSLASTVKELRGVFSDGVQPQGGAASADGLKATGAIGYLSAPAAELGPLQRLQELAGRTLGLVAQVNGQPEEKRRLLSALLHVLAEAVLSDEDDEAIKAHGESLKDALVELSLTPEQNDSLLKFLNYRALKEHLR